MPEDSSAIAPAVSPPTTCDKPAASSLDHPVAVAALNKQAAVLENIFFPAQVLAALGLGEQASITAARLFLARFREEAGQAADGVERVLIDQLIVAHLKIGELYALSACTSNLDFKKLYHNSAARLLGAVCQLVLTLSSYRASSRARQKQSDVQTGDRLDLKPPAGRKKPHTKQRSKRTEGG